MNAADTLRAVMSYDPNTGVFLRTAKTGQNVKVGAVAGHLTKQGYRRIHFDGRLQAAHRLAWLYVYGSWPTEAVDHINGKRDDNRIANLRLVDHSTNLENQRFARVDNKLGVLGVRKKGDRFSARIWVKGKARQIGSYATVEEASAAYLAAKRELHTGCTL